MGFASRIGNWCLLLTLLLFWTPAALASGEAQDKRPFLLGGIQLNEDDHERWSAALIQSGMNAVEVTVYATQGPWNRAQLWFADDEPSVRAEIRAARRNGLQVVLILRIAIDHSDPANRFLWHGLIFPETQAEVAAWFRQYTDFVVKWARIAAAEGVEVLGIASEMSSLEATLPVDEIPELAEYYFDDDKQAELRTLIGRHLDLFDDAERVAMGAGDFDSLDEFLIERNRAERGWARTFTFLDEGPEVEADDEARRIAAINHRRQLLQKHWQQLIAEVRDVYPGLLTLASNFDNYHEVGFWPQLDLIGINAYFPLRKSLDSPVDMATFSSSWRRVFADIDSFKASQKLDQPVIFTELGYTQRRGVSFAPWSGTGFVPIFEPGEEREDSILMWSAQPKEPAERALAVRSLFEVWNEDRAPLAGLLYWKLSSRLELGRYEPFMLYLGTEGGDPLYEAITLFADKVRPMDDPFARGRRYRRWYEAVLADEARAVTELRGRPPRRSPLGTLPPLHLAVQLGQREVVQALVERGAKVRQRDRSGALPLHWACQQSDPDLVRWLLPPSRISWQDDMDETPMMKCARLDNTAVLEELLRQRPDLVDARNRQSQTALWLAADQASTRTVELLVESGADAAAGDDDGVTPLHIAARRGVSEIVDILAAATDSHVRDDGGSRPVDWAAYFGRVEAFQRLWQPDEARTLNVDGQNLLHHAAHGGDTTIVETLLAAGFDPRQRDRSGRTPLHHATMKIQIDVAALLVQHGADIATTDVEGTTALHLAAAANDPHLLQIFLAKKPDLALADGDGNTPLHHAAGWGRVENARMLIAAGASTEALNHSGRTPLQIAEESGRKRVVKLLWTQDS